MGEIHQACPSGCMALLLMEERLGEGESLVFEASLCVLAAGTPISCICMMKSQARLVSRMTTLAPAMLLSGLVVPGRIMCQVEALLR